MKIDDLNELPEWEDDEFGDDENKAEKWKPNYTREACKAMYRQWNTVMIVLKASFDSMNDPAEGDPYTKEMLKEEVAMIMNDARQVAVKIKSSEAGLYILRMENAAIIRSHAQHIKISTNGFLADGVMDPEHRLVIRDEIDKFRELFKAWVNTFTKDEFEDEWGLFT